MNKKFLTGLSCIVMIAVLMIAVLTITASFAKTVAPGEKPLPPDIMPVVFVQGTDYEMGKQFGKQVAPYVKVRSDFWWAFAYKTIGTRDKILRELKAYEYFIKKDAPELIDFMKGIAEGATAAGYPVSYTDVVLINTAKSLKPIPPEGGAYPSVSGSDIEGCGHFHAWGKATKGGKLICGDNRDEPPNTPQVCLIAFPKTGNAFLTTTDAGQVACHPIMNNKGVFIGGSSGPGSRPVDKQYGIPRPCALAHMGRFSNNAIEAKDWAVAHQCVWRYTINFSMADVHGNAFVVEHSPAIKGVRKPGDFGEVDFIFATNNYLLEKMRVTGDVYRHTSEYRNAQLFDLLRNFQGKIDVEFFKMLSRNGEAHPVSSLKNVWKAGKTYMSNEWTARVVVATPDNGNNGVAHICTGHPSRKTLANLLIDPTGTFYDMTLAANPLKVTETAAEAADWALTMVWPKLMKLNYGDAAYVPVMKLVVKAKEKYYKGLNILDTAVLASYTGKGEEALYAYSKAATYFAKSQALARQAYEALVPPATTPEELGLERPWPFIRWERPPHSTEWKQVTQPAN